MLIEFAVQPPLEALFTLAPGRVSRAMFMPRFGQWQVSPEHLPYLGWAYIIPEQPDDVAYIHPHEASRLDRVPVSLW